MTNNISEIQEISSRKWESRSKEKVAPDTAYDTFQHVISKDICIIVEG